MQNNPLTNLKYQHISNEREMLRLGEKIGKEIRTKLVNRDNEKEAVSAPKVKDYGSVVIEMIGDVGAGKTTLTRGIARGLGISEAVTSPSFTLSKRYEFPGGDLVHYDFYRLDEPGILAETLMETISDPRTITIVEWGESVKGILPEKRRQIKISYNEDGSRNVEILN